MITVKPSIIIPAAIKPETVAIPAKGFTLIRDDPKDMPPLRLPITGSSRFRPPHWGKAISLTNDLQDLFLRKEVPLRLVVQMPHGHYFQETDRKFPGSGEFQQRDQLRIVHSLDHHGIDLSRQSRGTGRIDTSHNTFHRMTPAHPGKNVFVYSVEG